MYRVTNYATGALIGSFRLGQLMAEMPKLSNGNYTIVYPGDFAGSTQVECVTVEDGRVLWYENGYFPIYE